MHELNIWFISLLPVNDKRNKIVVRHFYFNSVVNWHIISDVREYCLGYVLK